MLYKRAEKILKKLLSFSEKPNLAFEFNQIIKASLKRISGDKLESDLEFLTKEGLIGFVGINSYQAIYVTNSGYTYFDEKHSMNKTIHRTETKGSHAIPVYSCIHNIFGWLLSRTYDQVRNQLS
ncbi:hypothetical protein [Lactiplantibacillus plantarum]|uniref:hypothetical protein n=1 Tax=Lactiplantibacillus plantarum TaxID=1590 RepID=UPI0013671AA8|nr:hypothetical protein [Lactiplantibacillus plantarum]QHM23525.1 hypothetical protein C7M32_00004 [Lactiplantibacillus plantarum]